MPAIDIDSSEKRKVDELVRFVRTFAADLSVPARMVFAIEIGRLLKPEIDEFKRRKASEVPA